METIYQHELQLFRWDWLKQKKDRHTRYMTKHRAKYPIKTNLVQIALAIILPLQALTQVMS